MKAFHAEVIARRARGEGPKAIAYALQIDLSKVESALRCARRLGNVFPPLRNETKLLPKSDALPRLTISRPLFAELQAEAQRNDRTPSELAGQILQRALIGTADPD